MKLLARLVLFVSGWRVKGAIPPHITQAVMIAAPHTSNWDIVYALAALYMLNAPVKFTIKKEWMDRFPFGLILRPLGAIPIDRNPSGNKKIGMVEAMINLFEGHDKLVVMVPPEGTRQYAERWRTGFYHVALGAEVPILLGFLDYKNKEAGVLSTVIEPTGNVEEDIERIKSLYRPIQGKHPERGVR